jgi:hypothetical protein
LAARTQDLRAGGPRGGNGPNHPNQGCCLPAAEAPLTADEARTLAFLREEEKLAHDVYAEMYAKWNLRVFDSIARSEQQHFAAAGMLIARYGIADPAAATPPGVFTDATLTTLYNQLIAKGMASLKDALEVGIAIETQDSADLETAIGATAKTDLKAVYSNLLTGSLNHREAFEGGRDVRLLVQ